MCVKSVLVTWKNAYDRTLIEKVKNITVYDFVCIFLNGKRLEENTKILTLVF